uniref:Zinc finger C2HC domain-containing protein 1A n=1 Tax=Paramormyrops kingsleyae TaxID=1676925 RepID=A0A3B3RMD6_9TELE
MTQVKTPDHPAHLSLIKNHVEKNIDQCFQSVPQGPVVDLLFLLSLSSQAKSRTDYGFPWMGLGNADIDNGVRDGAEVHDASPPIPDYIQCPYCRRRFGQSAADRHIAFCKEQAARIPNKGKIAGEGKAKLPARSLYKPPLAKRDGPAAASVTSPSSRLPQRSLQGQYGGGKPPNRAPSAGLIRNAPSASPPSRFGPSGAAEFPPGPPCSPGSLRTTPGIGTNSRRVHYADNNSLRYSPATQQLGSCSGNSVSYPLKKFAESHELQYCAEALGHQRKCLMFFIWVVSVYLLKTKNTI